MPGYKRKYTKEQEGVFKVRALDILNNSEEALTINDIRASDPMILGPVTSQKLSRVLGTLIDLGFVKKSKSREKNCMVYKAVSKMREQGYEVEESTYIDFQANPYRDWELEEEMRLKRQEEEICEY